jgi:hypothetical protein
LVQYPRAGRYVENIDFEEFHPAGRARGSPLQTVPGKGWNILFRLYGPLQPWFDRTWRPGEFELVK